MSQSAFERLYPRLPVALQNLACSAYGYREKRVRFGPAFHQRLDELIASDRWSAGDLQALQDERLAAVVRYAYDNVPYHRERMQALKLTPADVRRREDLPKLPVLTKEEVRRNWKRMVSTAVRPGDLLYRKTSGTTGKSLSFYTSAAGFAFQWAVWWRHRQRFGIPWGSSSVNFTGKLVVPMEQRRPPYWRWNRPLRQALLGMQHLSRDNVPAIVEFLDRHEFDFYSGYPSVVHAFAAGAAEAGLTLRSRPRAVITGAETMYDFQKRDIQALTGAVITDQYGFSEGCGNASHCEELVYHEDAEFGVLECVDPEPAEDGGTRGKIVCTGFANPEFPFLRYEVGDTAVWDDPARPCACGRHSRVIRRVEGRLEDYVLTPEGGRIMRFDYIFKDTANVKESQVVQERLGEVKIRVVRRPGYATADEALITREIHHWISPALRVRYEYVDEIEREANGKFRAVRSLLQGTPGRG